MVCWQRSNFPLPYSRLPVSTWNTQCPLLTFGKIMMDHRLRSPFSDNNKFKSDAGSVGL